jgi:hypothetical protein
MAVTRLGSEPFPMRHLNRHEASGDRRVADLQVIARASHAADFRRLGQILRPQRLAAPKGSLAALRIARSRVIRCTKQDLDIIRHTVNEQVHGKPDNSPSLFEPKRSIGIGARRCRLGGRRGRSSPVPL